MVFLAIKRCFSWGKCLRLQGVRNNVLSKCFLYPLPVAFCLLCSYTYKGVILMTSLTEYVETQEVQHSPSKTLVRPI